VLASKNKLWTSTFGTTYSQRITSIKIANEIFHKSILLISSWDIFHSI